MNSEYQTPPPHPDPHNNHLHVVQIDQIDYHP